LNFISKNIGFSVFDGFPEMYVLLSDEGRILNANKAAKELLSVESVNEITESFFDLFDSSEKEFVQKEFNESVLTETHHKFETRLRTKKQTYIPGSILFVPFKEEKSFCLVLIKNLTSEKEKELELLRFSYVTEHTVNPLQITDTMGRMIYVNPAFEKASGYTCAELIGKNPNVFSSHKHSPKFWQKMWDTINRGELWIGEVENKRKNGEPFFAQLLISPIINANGQIEGHFGIHIDITEKRNLDRQLIHTQKMESIGTLAAGVAHEVGNPLASISALVQVAQRSTRDEFIKDRLELVKKQVTRISKIIRDLVDFSRPSNYELVFTDLNPNLKEAVEIVKVGKKAKNINFKVELDNSLPRLPLVADQLQQVFVNILINAVDAISDDPNASQKQAKEINASTYKDDENIYIKFRDNGMGIPAANLSKIFEPFYTTKKEGRGTGLGLWVSYGIIKSFQGDISVSSIVGKETTFLISIPVNT